jgi:microcystin-dependent protein
MSNYEATKYDFDGANLTGIEGIPTATIVPWSDASVPSGFLECNGAAVSRTTYADLFAIISTTYGAGDGSTTFNVPDLQDNVPIGKSNNKSIGSTGGANTVTSTGNVGGSTANATLSQAQLAAHPHPNAAPYRNPGPNAGQALQIGSILPANQAPGPSAAPWAGGPQGSSSGHAHNMSANFSGDATSVLQPYLTVIYIIKT